MVYNAMIGARVKRKEDPRLITGKATFVANLTMPGMGHVAFVRSPYAHAQIRGIDSAAALKREGVLAVVTGEALKSHYAPLSMMEAVEKAKQHTHFALSVERVRYVGEAVAAVIATSAVVAEDAVNDVVVDWEPLPAVGDPEKALSADAPRVHDDVLNNVAQRSSNKTGDVDVAFSQAYRVVSQRLVSQRLAGVPMEGRAVLAAPDPMTDGLTVWTSTQAPHSIRSGLAALLNLPENLIRVVAPDVGGGFGIKGEMYPEEVAVSALARLLQRPLRWVESRLEGMLTARHGRGQIATIEGAVQADGTVTAIRVRILADVGAYPVFTILPQITGWMAVGTYRIPAIDVETTSVFTNTVPIAAYRGAGRPEAAYYIERLMDCIAVEMNMDPADIRRKNFIPPEAFPYKSPTHMTYDSGAYAQALDKAQAIGQYADLRAEQARRLAENSDRLLGIGIATYVEICGVGPYESAVVRVEPSGTVTVYTGISPHGQGQETTFAQIVADQIGADYSKIVVRHGDTAAMPMGIGTFGSRGLAVGGGALMQASAQVRHKAQQIAAHILEAAVEDVVLDNGRYQVRGVPDRGLTLADVAKRAYSDNLPHDVTSGLDSTEFFRPGGVLFPFGAHLAVVEIERETGIVHVIRYISVDDCGPRISPMLVEGQVHGGLAQGIGQALLEGIVYDEQGQLLTGSLLDYALPRADIFPQFTTDQTVTPTPHNPMGVKGIGEAATIGSTPAIVNAVMDALKPFGVRHLDMPLRPEKIWRALTGAVPINT